MRIRPKILTWHVHGSYLYYLSRANCDFYIPYKEGRPTGYGGLPPGNYEWGENMHEIEANKVRDLDLDCILFQSETNYLVDQYLVLSKKQRDLPKVYLEHDPPRKSPTDTMHVVDDPAMLVVHVTSFNELMWDTGGTPTVVIEHGVDVGDVEYSGKIQRGIVVVNDIDRRGRRLGFDVFENVRKEIPLDIIGMGSERVGGLGEVRHEDLFNFLRHYRFLFNPIRYTSMGIAVCEAMMMGMPVVGLATTEMPQIVKSGIAGFVSNDISFLKEKMRLLIERKDYAEELGAGAKRIASARFDLKSFAKDWEDVFLGAISKKSIPERNMNFRFQGGLS